MNKERQELIYKLEEELQLILDEKLGQDSEDHDSLKAEVRILDRKQHWPYHYEDIPYDHKAESIEELKRIFQLYQLNANLANGDLNRTINIMRIYNFSFEEWFESNKSKREDGYE